MRNTLTPTVAIRGYRAKVTRYPTLMTFESALPNKYTYVPNMNTALCMKQQLQIKLMSADRRTHRHTYLQQYYPTNRPGGGGVRDRQKKSHCIGYRVSCDNIPFDTGNYGFFFCFWFFFMVYAYSGLKIVTGNAFNKQFIPRTWNYECPLALLIIYTYKLCLAGSLNPANLQDSFTCRH